jgi:hypothetical protein
MTNLSVRYLLSRMEKWQYHSMSNAMTSPVLTIAMAM